MCGQVHFGVKTAILYLGSVLSLPVMRFGQLEDAGRGILYVSWYMSGANVS